MNELPVEQAGGLGGLVAVVVIILVAVAAVLLWKRRNK